MSRHSSVRARSRQSGLSLLELMVSIAIGAILMTGLVASFNSSSETRRELEKAGIMIENGRYAIGLLQEDLRHAGFFGHYYNLGSTPTALPDPCEAANLANLEAGLKLPIQGYRASSLATRPNVNPTTCDDKGLLIPANVAFGSDILVIRRADTDVLDTTDAADTDTVVSNEVYLQSNSREAELMFGVGGTAVPTKRADNAAQTVKKSPVDPASGWADTRKYRVHVYFIAPCSVGSAAGGVCAAGDDDIPTLKRLELTASGGVAQMSIVPLVEGIEFLKVEFGLDNSPSIVNSATESIGDGIPDLHVPSAGLVWPTLSNWQSIVSVRVSLLSRSLQTTQGHQDVKSYVLADKTIDAKGDPYKRQVYTTEVRPMNMAGRREIPQ